MVDIGLEDFGGDKINGPGSVLIVDGVEVPPEKQAEVLRVKEADRGMPPLQTDQQIKNIFPGER